MNSKFEVSNFKIKFKTRNFNVTFQLPFLGLVIHKPQINMSLQHPWNILEPPLKLPWNTLEISLKHPGTSHKTLIRVIMFEMGWIILFFLRLQTTHGFLLKDYSPRGCSRFAEGLTCQTVENLEVLWELIRISFFFAPYLSDMAYNT